MSHREHGAFQGRRSEMPSPWHGRLAHACNEDERSSLIPLRGRSGLPPIGSLVLFKCMGETLMPWPMQSLSAFSVLRVLCGENTGLSHHEVHQLLRHVLAHLDRLARHPRLNLLC